MDFQSILNFHALVHCVLCMCTMCVYVHVYTPTFELSLYNYTQECVETYSTFPDCSCYILPVLKQNQ